MAQNRNSWLAAPNVSWTWVVVVCSVWTCLLLVGHRSEVGEYLEARLARPVDFRVRDWLGRSPRISERLKIYSIDDSTFARMGSWVLTTDQYSKVLRTLADNKPRAIFIDGMFSKAVDPEGLLPRAIERLEGVDVPIVSGSFVTPQPIGYREPLDLSRSEFYSLATLLNRKPGDPIDEAELPTLVDNRKWFAYGPEKELKPIFRSVGHFLYPGTGKVAPLIRLGEDAIVPHLTMFLAQERRIEAGRLIVEGHPVPLDGNGLVTVNFAPPTQFQNSNRSMKGLLQLALAGRQSSVVKPGDVVLILPHMYTGHTDFGTTPFGEIPAGFVLACMLNSILTGQWLKPLVAGELLIALTVGLGGVVGAKLGALAFWLALVGGITAIATLSIYMFAFNSIVVPWILPLVGFIGAAVAVFTEKTRVGEKKVQTLRLALEGSVAPDELKSILKKPEQISFEARERVVTLMFIDVVGFSLLAENMLPRIAFENLKKMLATIGETIHQFGGIIDKTLGDGLLCYFGYRFDVDSSTPDHAEQALRCAIRIQQDNLQRNIEAAENGDPVYPLRIGINTSSCYLGDLGSGQRIDFTVVGNGVNFAKRLEGACEMHSCLFGATTHDLVRGIGLPPQAVTKRFIRIKHHSELVEAYEYDPFWEQPELRLAALEGFRKCANIERVDQRWPVHDPTKIQLHCDFGEGQLVNFSHTGFSVKLKQLLAKGTRLNISLDGAGGTLKQLLAKEKIEILQGEVRWGYVEGTEYVHGIMLTNVSDEQSDYLVQYLCEFAFARDSKRDKDKPQSDPHAPKAKAS